MRLPVLTPRHSSANRGARSLRPEPSHSWCGPPPSGIASLAFVGTSTPRVRWATITDGVVSRFTGCWFEKKMERLAIIPPSRDSGCGSAGCDGGRELSGFRCHLEGAWRVGTKSLGREVHDVLSTICLLFTPPALCFLHKPLSFHPNFRRPSLQKSLC